jgi:hypothetical protein
MTDPAYLRLGLPPTTSPLTVMRAAVRALHPETLPFKRVHLGFGMHLCAFEQLGFLYQRTRFSTDLFSHKRDI